LTGRKVICQFRVPRRFHAALVLLVLTGLNFFNYIDRYVLPAVQPLIQKELHRSDADMGWLSGVFFGFYMCAAPVMGLLADRYPRKWLVALGALVWSGATLLTAFTYDYRSLLIRHTIVGIGEASFVTIAPAIVADLFPEHRRGRMLSLFYLAIPMGSALGYILGGHLGPRYGWRVPFYIAALPGFVLAVMLMLLPETERGVSDRLGVTPERSTLIGLLSNRAYWSATLGMAAMTFAMGGVSVWMPTFLSRVRSIPLATANTAFGGLLVIAGFLATLAGGWVGDHFLRHTRRSYYLVSATGLAISLPFMVLAIHFTGGILFPAIFTALFFLFLNTGPLNAAIINSVASPIRATAVAVNIFVIHLLGDAFSPGLIGWISDRTGSLTKGLSAAIVAVAISSAILFYGSRFAPRIEIAADDA
jgi:MFS transporter, Spinster family, sphingosine-1-phosphate transporter